MEISRLTQELHQRDITIASASGSTSDLEQRLRTEIERAERKAVEHRVKKAEDSYALSLRDPRASITTLVFSYVNSFLLSSAFEQGLETLLMKSPDLWCSLNLSCCWFSNM